MRRSRRTPSSVAAPNWQDWPGAVPLVRAHGDLGTPASSTLRAAPNPSRCPACGSSAIVFPMLGVAPQLGRTFTAEEEAPGHRVVVISDALWRRRFGAPRGRHRPDAAAQRPAVRDHRRHAAGVSFHSAAPRRLGSDRTSRSVMRTARLALVLRRRPAEARTCRSRRRKQTSSDRQPSSRNSTSEPRRGRDDHADERSRRVRSGADAAGAARRRRARAADRLRQRREPAARAGSTARQREFAIRAALGAGRGAARVAAARGGAAARAGSAALPAALLAWIGTAALAESCRREHQSRAVPRGGRHPAERGRAGVHVRPCRPSPASSSAWCRCSPSARVDAGRGAEVPRRSRRHDSLQHAARCARRPRGRARRRRPRRRPA